MRAAALFIVAMLMAFAMRAAAAPPPCTQITDTLYINSVTGPVTMNGTLFVNLMNATPSGYQVASAAVSVNVKNGALSACLVPGFYQVNYQIPGSLGTAMTKYTRYWSVTSTAPATVSVIESDAAPPTSYAGLVNQLPKPPARGTFCITTSNGIVTWQTCPDSSTPQGATWLGLGVGATWPSKTWNQL